MQPLSVLLSLLLVITLQKSALGASTVRCGLTWADANGKCGLDCPSRTDQECAPLGEHCYIVDLSACQSNPPPPPPPVAPIPVTPSPPVGSTTPKFVTYVDYIPDWNGADALATALGLPSKRKHSYNVINLAFWTTTGGAVDASGVWANAGTYLKDLYPGVTTTSDIQLKMIEEYHNHNIKVLVSAFGATDHPTSSSATDIANRLAAFVTINHLDGVDLDYEDSDALSSGNGVQWLITLTSSLRTLLQDKIITHAPQAPYFSATYGYFNIHKQVGSKIDWYNVQFYNQDSTTYDTYSTLFLQSNGWSTGTAVAQIVAGGIPKSKLVVGKGVAPGDVSNGFIALSTLKDILQQGKNAGYTGGFMGWQLSSDPYGTWSSTLASVFLPSGAIEETGAIAGAQAEVGLSTLHIGLIVAAALVATIIIVAVVLHVSKNRRPPFPEIA